MLSGGYICEVEGTASRTANWTEHVDGHFVKHATTGAMYFVKGGSKYPIASCAAEAVMCSVRLCRFNTRRKLIVQFAGAYHGGDSASVSFDFST